MPDLLAQVTPLTLSLAALVAAAIAALATNTVVPGVARLAVLLRALDEPGERKLQADAVPRLGGVAIVVGVALGAGGVAMTRWNTWGGHIARSELAAFLIGTGLVFVVGLVDDILGVSALKKILVEIAAAWLIVAAGWRFDVVHLPVWGDVQLGVLGNVVVVAWIVGVTNAINLLDGLDGLASGVVTIIAASFLVYAILLGNPMSVVLLGGVVGACLGFLRFNWAPAKIYMGDSGALTLGFLLAAMSVHSSLKAPAAVAILVPIVALGVPVLDTLLVMAVRFLERPKGQLGDRFLRMFRADRQHLHHLLETHGARRQRIVATIWAIAAVFCALAIMLAATKSDVFGVTLIGLEFAVVLGMRNLGLMTAMRKLALRKRTQIRSEMFARGAEVLPAPDPERAREPTSK